MKALDILYRYRMYREGTNNYPTPREYDEAIEELEQLSSNSLQLKEENEKLHNAWVDCVERYEGVLNKQIIKEKQTCEGCKWYEVRYHSATCNWCERHPSRKTRNIKDYWESK